MPKPLLIKPFCLDNMILAGLSGSFAPCSVSAFAGHYDDEGVISLTRQPVNTPRSAMQSERIMRAGHCRKKGTLLRQGKRSQGQPSLQWERKPTVPPSQCGRQCLPGSPAHRMISSAWKRSVGGMVRPNSCAVFRLMTSSNFMGCSTGKSAGLAPFRILSTYLATPWNWSGRLTP